MKKKIIIFIVIVLAAVAAYSIFGALGVVPLPKFITETLSRSNEQLTDMERIPIIIQEEHPTELILLGDDIPFEVSVPVRKITDITEDSLKRSEGYDHSFFIINDLNGTVQLTEEDIALLAEQISHPDFCLSYFGTKYSSVWDDPNQYIASLKGNLSWKYYQLDGQPRRYIGAWTQNEQMMLKEYPYMLGNILLYEIEAYLIEIN